MIDKTKIIERDYARKPYRASRRLDYAGVMRSISAKSSWDTVLETQPSLAEFTAPKPMTAFERKNSWIIRQSEFKKPYKADDYSSMESNFDGVPGVPYYPGTFPDHPWITETPLPIPAGGKTWVLYAYTDDNYCNGWPSTIVIHGTHPIYSVTFLWPGLVSPSTSFSVVSGIGTNTVTILLDAHYDESPEIQMKAYERAYDAPATGTQGKGWTNFTIESGGSTKCKFRRYALFSTAAYIPHSGGSGPSYGVLWDLDADSAAVEPGLAYPVLTSTITSWLNTHAYSPSSGGSVYSFSKITCDPKSPATETGAFMYVDQVCGSKQGCATLTTPTDWKYDSKNACTGGYYQGKTRDWDYTCTQVWSSTCSSRTATMESEGNSVNYNTTAGKLTALVTWATAHPLSVTDIATGDHSDKISNGCSGSPCSYTSPTENTRHNETSYDMKWKHLYGEYSIVHGSMSGVSDHDYVASTSHSKYDKVPNGKYYGTEYITGAISVSSKWAYSKRDGKYCSSFIASVGTRGRSYESTNGSVTTDSYSAVYSMAIGNIVNASQALTDPTLGSANHTLETKMRSAVEMSRVAGGLSASEIIVAGVSTNIYELKPTL